MKNIKKAIKAITISSVLCISLTAPTFADVRINQNVLIQIERYEEPSGGWQPGDSREIKFAIKNNTNMNMKIDKLYMIEKSRDNLNEAFKEMAENTWITIKDGDTAIKERIKLKDFLSSEDNNSVSVLDKYINLSPGRMKELTMSIDMEEKMGNPAQSLSKVFSLGTVYTLTSTGGGGGTVTPPIDPEKPTPPTPEEPSNPDGGDTTLPEKPDTGDGTDKPGTGDSTDKPGTGDNDSNNGGNVGGSGDKLPQTGGIINGATLTVLGIGVAGLGLALDRKSSDKGGKSDE